jgi:hypothetical protein
MGSRRVRRGIEGWFDTEGTHLVDVTRWMPIPDDPIDAAQANEGEKS